MIGGVFLAGPSTDPPRIVPNVSFLWTGALKPDGLTVCARLSHPASEVRLAVSDGVTTGRGPLVASAGRDARLTITGLAPDTTYTYRVEAYGVPVGPAVAFRTAPAPGPASFTVAFAGDASVGSNHAVFDRIRLASPLMFVHLGDMFYGDITANDPALYRAQYDTVFAQPRQAQLYRDVPTVYVWDDHDVGPNDADSTYVGLPAAAQVYRERVPHYPLVTSGAIYHSFTIGRVRFVVTDQRHDASVKTAPDNASKSVLGSAQKAWWKAEVAAAAAAGQLVAWICPRVWGGVPAVGQDHWGSFTAERRELADYIHATWPGRVVVISADMHSMGIDDGSHHAYGTGGTEPLRTFQAAPLDRVPHTTYAGPPTYSQGGLITVQGVFGTMSVTDTGGSSVDVLWEGRNSAGTLLTSLAFTVTV